MRVPSDRLLVAARRGVHVASEVALLECLGVRVAEVIAVPEPAQRSAIRELLEAAGEKIVRGHLPTSYRINRASRDVLANERIPRKIDCRQADFGDIFGE